MHVRAAALAAVLALVAGRAAAQCPPAWGLPADPPTWCDRASGANPTCTVNAGDGTHTPCNQGAATEWLMREGNDFCQNCPYAFYVVVDCSTEFHVPNHDVEAMSLSVIDMLTGAPVLLTVQNECAVRRDHGDPFVYCDGCRNLGSLLPKDDAIGGSVNKPAGSCVLNPSSGSPMTLPEIPCLPYQVTDFTGSWGIPLDGNGDGSFDDDGDGSVDDMLGPPCSTCNDPPCPCGLSTPANKVTEEQFIDVKLHGEPLLSGVYRVELLSGGLEWQLYSNCDGSNTPQFPIYDTCAAAFAAWQPVPELALHDNPDVAFFVEDSLGCPASVIVGVTTCNRSRGAASPSAPFTIGFGGVVPPFDGDNAAHPTDPACQAPLDPGECRTCLWTVPLGATGLNATITIDASSQVAECSESLTNARCGAEGRRTQVLGLCGADGNDADRDGLEDWREINLGFSPSSADADLDGVTDPDELARGTDPGAADSDGDGVPDDRDVCPVTRDAGQADSDRDGIGNACEPGARDVLTRLSKLFDGRLKLEWDWVEGVEAHDLAAGDLDALRSGTYTHDVLSCSLPPGFTGRIVQDPIGAGRSRYYLLGCVFPGPDEWGATSFGVAVPGPATVPACR